MRAVVFHGIGDIRLDEVAEPQIEDPNNAIVRIRPSIRQEGWVKVELRPAA